MKSQKAAPSTKFSDLVSMQKGMRDVKNNSDTNKAIKAIMMYTGYTIEHNSLLTRCRQYFHLAMTNPCIMQQMVLVLTWFLYILYCQGRRETQQRRGSITFQDEEGSMMDDAQQAQIRQTREKVKREWEMLRAAMDFPRVAQRTNVAQRLVKCVLVFLSVLTKSKINANEGKADRCLEVIFTSSYVLFSERSTEQYLSPPFRWSFSNVATTTPLYWRTFQILPQKSILWT
jgi:hypothetical protein